MRYITTHDAPPTGLRGIADHSWHERALCRGLDPAYADELFFPRPRDICAITEAKQICARCPVRQTCFNAALDTDTRHGIWGGLTEDERKPWHQKIAHRLDYARVRAVFHGRDLHLSSAERSAVVRHAYARGWRAERLAALLRVDYSWARDLLLAARHEIADRTRHWALFDQNNEEETAETEEKDAATENNDRAKKGTGKGLQPPPRHEPHTQDIRDDLNDVA
ncbi:hypothetical protein AN219_37890 [Streptomyces nanshensis]|nr:hypothetical protein AN219_37890 [Streptomyces nanshensis]